MSDKPSSPTPREGGREGEIDPLLLYARRCSLSIRFYFTTSVVVVVVVTPLTDAKLTVRGVKYEPSVDAHCCCYVPFSLPPS